MVNVKINGIDIAVQEGTTILEAARQAAEAANASKQKTTNSNRGCIGNDSSNFY